MTLFEQIELHLGTEALVFWDRDGMLLPAADAFTGGSGTCLVNACACRGSYVSIVQHNGRFFAGWTGKFVQRVARACSP